MQRTQQIQQLWGMRRKGAIMSLMAFAIGASAVMKMIRKKSKQNMIQRTMGMMSNKLKFK